MSDQGGDWYCPQCGYLSAGRVTFSETCDECHTPVEWHTVNQMSEIDRLSARIKELENPWLYPSKGDAMPEEGLRCLMVAKDPYGTEFEPTLIHYKAAFFKAENNPSPISLVRWMPIPQESE